MCFEGHNQETDPSAAEQAFVACMLAEQARGLVLWPVLTIKYLEN